METCGSCTIIPRNKGNDYHSAEAHRGRVEEGRIHQCCQCHRAQENSRSSSRGSGFSSLLGYSLGSAMCEAPFSALRKQKLTRQPQSTCDGQNNRGRWPYPVNWESKI